MLHDWYINLSRPLQNFLGHNTAQVGHRLAMVSGDLTGRQIAPLAEVPVVSAPRVFAGLAEIGLVHARDIGQARLYRLNREHVIWTALEAMMATPAIIEERVRSISLEKAPSETTVAIFGSFARGDAGLSSDITL